VRERERESGMYEFKSSTVRVCVSVRECVCVRACVCV